MPEIIHFDARFLKILIKLWERSASPEKQEVLELLRETLQEII